MSIVLIDRLSIVLIDHSTIVHWVSQILCPPDPFWPLRVYSLFYFVIIGSFLFHGRLHRHHISPAIQLVIDVTVLISSPLTHSSLNWWYMGIGQAENSLGAQGLPILHRRHHFCIILITINFTVLLLWNLRPQTTDQCTTWPASSKCQCQTSWWSRLIHLPPLTAPIVRAFGEDKNSSDVLGRPGLYFDVSPEPGSHHAIGIIRKVFFWPPLSRWYGWLEFSFATDTKMIWVIGVFKSKTTPSYIKTTIPVISTPTSLYLSFLC